MTMLGLTNQKFSPVIVFVLALATLELTLAQSHRRRCFLKTRPPSEPPECETQSRYRTISGRCNNLDNPEWGSTGSTFRRFLPPAYQDGVSVPRGGRNPSSLPNPRHVSQKNHPDSDNPDPRFTHMVMQFGQFLDHDLTLTPKDEQTNCCNPTVDNPECFPIEIPSPDRFYSWVNSSARCLPFIRSQPVCNEQVRQHYNILTSFVDASNVYGSEQEHASLLRTYVDGRLHRNSNTEQLPTREQLNVRPDTSLLKPEKSEDFMAGEMRVNEHPFLTTLHIVFVKEHNRIAKLLKEYLPSSLHDDETLYQETRRIVIGEMQNIVYGEYLPTILGVDFMKSYGLIVEEETTYDPNVDPTIFTSFGTAAFRFGHSMINGMFKLISQRPSSSDNKDVYWLWRLREIFDGQTIKGGKLPLENMLEGLITQEPQTVDAYFTTEITDHLFQKNPLRQNFGQDLLALNLQRGRDHGIPGYNKFRQACGLKPLQNWREKPIEYEEEYWLKLQDVYENVDDIDLFVGAIAEAGVRGGVVGPTFACLISEQFKRLKQGDRFFYTHTNANGLGPVTKQEVLQRTLGDVLCDVTEIQKVQKWVTLQPNDDYNPYRSCRNNRKLDLRSIAEEIARELLPRQGDIQDNRARALFNSQPSTNSIGDNQVNQQHLVVFREQDALAGPLDPSQPPQQQQQEQQPPLPPPQQQQQQPQPPVPAATNVPVTISDSLDAPLADPRPGPPPPPPQQPAAAANNNNSNNKHNGGRSRPSILSPACLFGLC